MEEMKKYLPESIIKALRGFEYINEIRLKRGARVCVRKDTGNYILDILTPDREFECILDKLFSHSYHSQLKNMVEGYISLGNGYRVGVAGRAVVRDGKVTNLSDIISVNIRVPHLIRGICTPVTDYIAGTNFMSGVLIYSAPGIGKTTLLRDTVLRLSDVPYKKRVALIDSRQELYIPEMSKYPLIDAYIGYPKAKGIELAIRTMSPDLIICDEIGNDEETDAVLANQSTGVPIIATAHGSSLSSLLARSSINRLYKNRVFGCYMGISRMSSQTKFRFEINEIGEEKIYGL